MTAVVTAQGLTRTFGPHRGIRDVSFDVGPGEVFGFLGPNGAGKSTTIRIILGLYRRDAGRVSVFGLDPAHHGVTINRRVGYLAGDLALHPRLTGREHLRFVAAARGLTDLKLRDELVERFGAELDRPLKTLSKGNKQKIGIVATFMHRPDLLVLDEPTSGLDPLLQDEFAHLVRENVDAGRSVFLSSHQLDEVQRVVDRVAIIKDGSIVVTDTIDGLRGGSPRIVEFRFDHDVDLSSFQSIDGVRVIAHDNRTVTLSIAGSLPPVLQAAADAGAVDITSRASDLDDLFLRYYQDTS